MSSDEQGVVVGVEACSTATTTTTTKKKKSQEIKKTY